MKLNWQKLVVTGLVLVFIFSAHAVSTNAQGTIEQILKRVDEHRKALTTLKSSIMMAKYDPNLNVADISEGNLLYAAKDGKKIKSELIRIDWLKPRQEMLSVVSGEYVLYIPNLKQAYKGKADSKQAKSKGKGALDFLGMSKEQLKANYSAQYLGQEKLKDGTDTWHLKFTPKTAGANKMAEVWVDGNGMIIQAKVVPNSGDETTVRLSNLEKNVTINGNQFAVVPPKGTKIING
jgi:outer membrane lipoprotein-sorting protein